MPWTVIGNVPVGVLAEVTKVRAELPAPAIDAGEKDAVTPVGMPLAARLTTPPKPFNAATVIADPAEPPATALTDAGDADSAKSDDPTVRLIVTALIRLPLVPCMAIG